MPPEDRDERNETQDHLPGERSAERLFPAREDEPHCPLCGGQIGRGWKQLPEFNFGAFLVFLMLSPFALPAFLALHCVVGAVLFLAWIVLVVGLFCALPISGAVAVVARAQCRSCGHAFQTQSDETDKGEATRLPIRSAVLGGVLLLIALVAGLRWFRNAPGQETGAVELRLLLRIIMAVLALGLGLLAQAIIWRRLRMRMMGGARLELLLLPAVALGAGWLVLTGYDHHVLGCRYDPVKRAPVVLDRAGLVALPASARDLKVHAWAILMSGRYSLRFAAEPNDIGRFLAESPSLKGKECTRYSSERMRLATRDHAKVFDRRDGGGHEYVYLDSGLPKWYRQEIRTEGRRYEVNWYNGRYQGELIVDDVEHVVYVHVDRYWIDAEGRSVT